MSFSKYITRFFPQWANWEPARRGIVALLLLCTLLANMPLLFFLVAYREQLHRQEMIWILGQNPAQFLFLALIFPLIALFTGISFDILRRHAKRQQGTRGWELIYSRYLPRWMVVGAGLSLLIGLLDMTVPGTGYYNLKPPVAISAIHAHNIVLGHILKQKPDERPTELAKLRNTATKYARYSVARKTGEKITPTLRSYRHPWDVQKTLRKLYAPQADIPPQQTMWFLLVLNSRANGDPWKLKNSSMPIADFLELSADMMVVWIILTTSSGLALFSKKLQQAKLPEKQMQAEQARLREAAYTLLAPISLFLLYPVLRGYTLKEQELVGIPPASLGEIPASVALCLATYSWLAFVFGNRDSFLQLLGKSIPLGGAVILYVFQWRDMEQFRSLLGSNASPQTFCILVLVSLIILVPTLFLWLPAMHEDEDSVQDFPA